MFKCEDSAQYNWQKRHDAYRELRGHITQANGAMTLRSPSILHARSTLAPTRSQSTPLGEACRVGISPSADQVCHNQLTMRFPKMPLQSHQVGSSELWPTRLLRKQNVMEWRNYMNTTAANNGMRDHWRTTQRHAFTAANEGKHWIDPSGKVTSNVKANHELQIYRSQKRCYKPVERPVNTCQHPITITLPIGPVIELSVCVLH